MFTFFKFCSASKKIYSEYEIVQHVSAQHVSAHTTLPNNSRCMYETRTTMLDLESNQTYPTRPNGTIVGLHAKLVLFLLMGLVAGSSSRRRPGRRAAHYILEGECDFSWGIQLVRGACNKNHIKRSIQFSCARCDAWTTRSTARTDANKYT